MIYVLGVAAVIVVWLLFGGSGGRRLRVARIDEEFEARLRPVQQDGPTWMASGKAERELRHDGTAEFALWCDGFRTYTGTPRLPLDALLEVAVDDEVIASVRLNRDRVNLKLSSAKGDLIPTVGEGSSVSIRYEGTVLLEGTFVRD